VLNLPIYKKSVVLVWEHPEDRTYIPRNMTRLPLDNHSLTEIFKDATMPNIDDFSGEYYVYMLTGLPSFRRFGHRKIFYTESGKVVGHNVIKIPWGHFSLEAGVSDLDGKGVVVIDYKRSENSFISKRIRDHVRCIGEGNLYIGRFNYMLMGKPYFIGYFLLSRV
jgi:hypothetical protein